MIQESRAKSVRGAQTPHDLLTANWQKTFCPQLQTAVRRSK